MRNAILFLEHRHALVVGFHELADVLERGPNHVLDAGRFRRLGDVLGLSLLFLAREVLPEIRDGIHAVRARKGFFQALDVVEIRFHYLRAGRGKRLRLVLARIARNGSAGEAASSIRDDGAAQATPLRTRGAQYCDNFFVCHVNSSVRRSV